MRESEDEKQGKHTCFHQNQSLHCVMNFIKNLKVCPSLFFMNICREGLADKSCSCLTFEHFIELDKLYQTTDTELNRLFIKRRKREKELERKKSVLTTMYDELQRLRDDIELTEKLLRALEKEYYETRNEMSSVLQSVISENLEKFALEEQPILYNQVMQIQDAKQAAMMLKSLRRQQAAMQYLASVAYSKFVQFNHGFISDDDSNKSCRPPTTEEKKVVPPNRRRKSAIPRSTVLTSVLRHNNPSDETGLDDDSRLIFDRNVEVLEQQESSDYDMDLC